MNDINLNIPYARIIPKTTLKKFTTRRLETGAEDIELLTEKLIDNRFQIIAVHSKIGPLDCYTVISHPNSKRCGACGSDDIHDSTQFCDQCGYRLSDSKFLILEGTKKQTTGFRPLIKKNIHYKGLLKFKGARSAVDV